jgi:hypothetical protein
VVARCIPESPAFTTHSEQRVWELLRDQLPSEAVIVANLRITDRKKDHELDLVVLVPGAGAVVLEVKGGEVWHDAEQWRQKRQRDEVVIDPVRQARDGRYAVRAFVEHDPRWGSRSRIRWGHAVVLAHSEVPSEFSLPDCPRWMVADRDDLAGLAALVYRVVGEQETTCRVPDADDVDAMAEILHGRGHPQRSVLAESYERDDLAVRLTQQQALVLDAARLLTRVEIRGGAGSGKTWLALEQARRLAKQGQRVALLCYSHGLASFLKREVASWPRKERPAYVGEYHSLGRLWGAPEGPDETERTAAAVDFWESLLPTQMADLARALPPGQRFDAVVVDEAQDFADSWWPAVLGALRDEEASEVYVFTDQAQQVFSRFGSPPVQLVPLVLDHNLRNTKQIADTFNPLTAMRMRLVGGSGPDVSFRECASEEALGAADDAVDELLDDGWRPEDVALLTTGSRHPEQAERQAAGHDAYWDTFWDADQVFYGHVLGFKGLERRAVVLALNEDEPHERSRERLYVGLSRARDQLVVCGDPVFVEAVGGPDVLKRLRRG